MLYLHSSGSPPPWQSKVKRGLLRELLVSVALPATIDADAAVRAGACDLVLPQKCALTGTTAIWVWTGLPTAPQRCLAILGPAGVHPKTVLLTADYVWSYRTLTNWPAGLARVGGVLVTKLALSAAAAIVMQSPQFAVPAVAMLVEQELITLSQVRRAITEYFPRSNAALLKGGVPALKTLMSIYG